MPIIQSSNADAVRGAIVLDLGDLSRQGEAIVAAARARAEALLAEARAERQRLIQGAAEQGRKQGWDEGRAAGLKAGAEEGRSAALKEHGAALAALERSWESGLKAFDAQRDDLLTSARAEVVRLALEIASRVVKRHVGARPGAVVDQLQAVLELVCRGSALAISINPADRETVLSALPALTRRLEAGTHAEVIDDPGVSRGGCVVAARGPLRGEIDARLDTQLERIAEALGVGRPDAAQPAGAAPGESEAQA